MAMLQNHFHPSGYSLLSTLTGGIRQFSSPRFLYEAFWCTYDKLIITVHYRKGFVYWYRKCKILEVVSQSFLTQMNITPNFIFQVFSKCGLDQFVVTTPKSQVFFLVFDLKFGFSIIKHSRLSQIPRDYTAELQIQSTDM